MGSPFQLSRAPLGSCPNGGKFLLEANTLIDFIYDVSPIRSILGKEKKGGKDEQPVTYRRRITTVTDSCTLTQDILCLVIFFQNVDREMFRKLLSWSRS